MNAEVHQEIVKCNKWVDEHTDSVWELRDSSQKFIQSQTDKLVFVLRADDDYNKNHLSQKNDGFNFHQVQNNRRKP